VGIESRGQVESEEERMAANTSEGEAGAKQGRRGGGKGGGVWGSREEAEEERREVESLRVRRGRFLLKLAKNNSVLRGDVNFALFAGQH